MNRIGVNLILFYITEVTQELVFQSKLGIMECRNIGIMNKNQHSNIPFFQNSRG